MNCVRCGRELRAGEKFCLNCGEPTITVTNVKAREKASDIVTCLVIGLFVLFGIPALLLGGFLLYLGVETLSKPDAHPSGIIRIILSVLPLAVFLTLGWFLIRVAAGRARNPDG